MDSPRIVMAPAPQKSAGDKTAPFMLNRVNINGGVFEFSADDYRMELLNVDLKSYKVKEQLYYSLKSPHLKIIFPFSKELVRIEGDMSATISQQGQRIQVHRFTWNTADFQLTGTGRTSPGGGFKFDIGFRGSAFQVLEPLLGTLSTRGMAYANAEVASGADGELSINGRFRFPEMEVNRENFRAVRGNAQWNSRSKRILVNLSTEDNGFRGRLAVTNRDGMVQLRLADFAGVKLARIIEIYDSVPLSGHVIAGEIRIKGSKYSGHVQVDRLPIPLADFNPRGPIRFTYDGRKKYATFQSSGLETDFGSMSLQGESDGRRNQLRLTARGTLSDFSRAEKYLAFYTGISLKPWKIAGGQGRFDIDLNKAGKRLDFVSHLKVDNTRANGIPIQTLTGIINGKNQTVTGRFNFSDPGLQGAAEFVSDADHLEIRFPRVDGSVARIFRILDLDIDLEGDGSGTCVYNLKKRANLPLISGTFTSPQLKFSGIPFTDLSGNFQTDTERLELTDLAYLFMKGKGRTDLTIDTTRREYALEGSCTGINLERLTGDLFGHANVKFSGSGAFLNDPINVAFSATDVYLSQQRSGTLQGTAAIHTDFSDFSLKADGKIIRMETSSDLSLELSLQKDRMQGNFRIQLQDLNFVIPWKHNRGQMDISGQIAKSPSGKTDIRGIVRFDGTVLSIPNFPHALEDFRGFLTFDNGAFSLQSFRATMGGGPVEGNGMLTLKQGGIQDLFFSLSGRNMTLYPIDRTVFTMDADLTLKKRDRKLLVQGNLNFRDSVWEREVDEGLSFYTDPETDTEGSGFFKLLDFDLKLTGKDNIRLHNSFGDIMGTLNLHLTGNSDFPRLEGTLESRRGTIFFSDHKFNLIKGRVTFNNRFVIDPMINLESETFIKNYRIRFNIKGVSSRLQPEFQSSPPLPQQDILALLSLGELFKRPTSTEMSSQIGTTGLITSQLTEEIQKRARNLGFDLVMKIDPVIAGTAREGTSRLTVGTSIARNLLIVYSTNISSLRQEIYYLQYQLSPAISLIGMRNQEGNFSIDIRYRRRRY
ncbi:MAG: translocation/assembly module TamB domain-containing protein [Candidatus Aminicenantes bacterium]|nr:translocation/assembly module TamB domain-containing protein [Candidatus Aminicenantes bacterium]